MFDSLFNFVVKLYKGTLDFFSSVIAWGGSWLSWALAVVVAAALTVSDALNWVGDQLWGMINSISALTTDIHAPSNLGTSNLELLKIANTLLPVEEAMGALVVISGVMIIVIGIKFVRWVVGLIPTMGG